MENTLKEAIKIKVEEEEAILCEKYYYEYSGLLTLVTQFTGKNIENNIDSTRFNSLIHEYMEAFVQYQMYWTELTNKYIPKEYVSNDYLTTLDFYEGTFIITESIGGSCACQK